MLRRTFSLWAASLAASGLLLATGAASAQELRVLVHSSFSLPKPMLAQFEAQSGIKLSIIKGGDAGEMLNKLILTKDAPLGDADAHLARLRRRQGFDGVEQTLEVVGAVAHSAE